MKYLEHTSGSVQISGSVFIILKNSLQLSRRLHWNFSPACVYMCQIVSMTEMTNVIFLFLKADLLYIVFLISFVKINF